MGSGAGIDGLGASVLIPARHHARGSDRRRARLPEPSSPGAGIGVGICSSVIPYVTDQMAMSRPPPATYALLLSLLPATATTIAIVVLHQVPRLADVAGIAVVIAGIALQG